jgi:hypothetical protein
MRARKHQLSILIVPLALLLFAPGLAQDRSASPRTASEDPELPDLSRLHPFHRVVYLSARRGTEWLWNANRPDGLFVSGHVPALKVELDDEQFVNQAGAAAALARGARLANTSRCTARARQAVLAMLASTRTDPANPGVRFTIFPESEVNRVAAASWLVLAIAELPEQGADLLEQLDQLSQFLVRQQEVSGHIRTELAATVQPTMTDAEVATLALRALARSQLVRPAGWKLDAAIKSMRYYHQSWQKERQITAASWLTCAAADLFAASKDKAQASVAFDLADWLCTLQYGAEPRRPHWQGAFAGWQAGKVVATPPGIDSARVAQAMAHACRAARSASDTQRGERYRECTERALQFVASLQYTSANTRHFADWYRSTLHGAFFQSPVDGTIRIEYTQHALWAMADYLEVLADLK